MFSGIESFIGAGLDLAHAKSWGIYPRSLHYQNGCTAFMAVVGGKDYLVVREGFGFCGQHIRAAEKDWVVCELNHKNAEELRRRFPFTAPIPVLHRARTVGVGDRLGIATPGHIRALHSRDVAPVFAQQSIRELNLTQRSFHEVIDCVSYAVFREDYTDGFGADGDHLKTEEEIRCALSSGCTMITLDCSEHIRNDVQTMTDEEVLAAYVPNEEVEALYLEKTFTTDYTTIRFDKISFCRMCLIYNKAIDFAVQIYHAFFYGRDMALDFEVSIDETATPTDPAQHFYVAGELIRRGVRPATIAPRFCGEFQKGIDYIGDLGQFEKEFAVHASIARYFGYKISVHSGSDKFSVYDIVNRCTNGNFHVKTAGTSWLEAMRMVAVYNPPLYREIHTYALHHAFEPARKYYHVATDLTRIPALDTLSDLQLPTLFRNDDARQLLHITYGLILQERNPDGTYRFRTRLYKTLKDYSEEYDRALETHIGKHLTLLGCEDKHRPAF